MSYQMFDGSPLLGGCVDFGRSGFILRIDDLTVIKVPRVWRDPHASVEKAEEYEIVAEDNRDMLENEKRALQRLGHHSGLVTWLNLSEAGIEMSYLSRASLECHLKTSAPHPDIVTLWILDIADTICYIHLRKVIIGDIALRNILLDHDFCVKLCDFADSTVLPLDADMESAEDNGLSVKTDIFQFGSLVYELRTGRAYEHGLFGRSNEANACCDPKPEWPRPEDLPSVEGITFGNVVRGCWTRTYSSMIDVYQALRKAVWRQGIKDTGEKMRVIT